MKKLLLFGVLAALLLSAGAVFGEGITFTFANGQITGSGPFYYEFDVMVEGSVGGTELGDCQAYINYNTVAFGSSITAAGKVTVTKGIITSGEVSPGFPYYADAILNDNSSSRLAITISFNYAGNSTAAGDLTTSPTSWAHVKIEISNPSASSGLSFQQSLFAEQVYEHDNTTKYDPVTATDTDDTSLPVSISTFTATAEAQQGVVVSWTTESESNTAGYNVLRAQSQDGPWTKLNNSLIPGQGNSSQAKEYTFTDRGVREGIEYWYKVEELTLDNQINVLFVTSVMGINAVPAEFSLGQNYPNPFNPETSFKYMVAEDGDVTIGIYNLLGKEIKRLVSGHKPAGYYTATWTGVDARDRSVASGIYFIRMQASNFQMVRKVSLMR